MAVATLDTLTERYTRKDGPAGSKLAIKVRRLSEKSDPAIRIMAYGDQGSGKTLAILAWLKAGYKILVLTTGIAGDGLLTLRTELAKLGNEGAEENLFVLGPEEGLETYRDLTAFLKEPEKFFPEIYDVGLGFVCWEEFTEAQLVYLEEEISSRPELLGQQQVSAAREEGWALQERDWNMVKNGTVRLVKDFLRLRNRKKPEEVWHKYLTCKEAEKEKVAGTGLNKGDEARYESKRTPLIQGSAKKIMEGAFDIILEMRAKTGPGGESAARIYEYHTKPHQSLTAKVRGIDLKPVEPGDMGALWAKIQAQL